MSSFKGFWGVYIGLELILISATWLFPYIGGSFSRVSL